MTATFKAPNERIYTEAVGYLSQISHRQSSNSNGSKYYFNSDGAKRAVTNRRNRTIEITDKVDHEIFDAIKQIFEIRQ